MTVFVQSFPKNKSDWSETTFNSFYQTTYLPQARLRRRSLGTEISSIKHHVLPIIGPKPLRDIAKIDIENIINSLITKGKAPSTINRIIAHIRTIFNRAIELDVDGINTNPAKGIKNLPNSKVHEKYLNTEEANRLITELHRTKNRIAPFIIAFMLLTGCRKREVLDAHWSNINLESSMLKIPLSKNGKPRYVVLSDEAKDILLHTRQYLSHSCPDYNWKDNWVFLNEATGKPFFKIQTGWETARRRAGLSDLRIHDLRHSFASALINSGMTLYDVKEALGHSNLVTTQRYAHLAPQRLMKAVSAAPKHYRLTSLYKTARNKSESLG